MAGRKKAMKKKMPKSANLGTRGGGFPRKTAAAKPIILCKKNLSLAEIPEDDPSEIFFIIFDRF